MAKNLYYLRKQKGLRQDQIPDFIGFKRTTWSTWELGSSKPSIPDILIISDFFGVDLNQLITEDLEAKGKVIENLKYPDNGKVTGKETGKRIDKNAQSHDYATSSAFTADKIAFKDQLIAGQKETIESLKQANSALSSLYESQKATIAALEAHITELKQKTGSG